MQKVAKCLLLHMLMLAEFKHMVSHMPANKTISTVQSVLLLATVSIRPCRFNQGHLKDGQESFSKIYKIFFRRYMPKPY